MDPVRGPTRRGPSAAPWEAGDDGSAVRRALRFAPILAAGAYAALVTVGSQGLALPSALALGIGILALLAAAVARSGALRIGLGIHLFGSMVLLAVLLRGAPAPAGVPPLFIVLGWLAFAGAWGVPDAAPEARAASLDSSRVRLPEGRVVRGVLRPTEGAPLAPKAQPGDVVVHGIPPQSQRGRGAVWALMATALLATSLFAVPSWGLPASALILIVVCALGLCSGLLELTASAASSSLLDAPTGAEQGGGGLGTPTRRRNWFKFGLAGLGWFFGFQALLEFGGRHDLQGLAWLLGATTVLVLGLRLGRGASDK